MIIEKGKIPNGLDDIATYLGLNPSNTLFLHSTSFNENDEDNIFRKSINRGRMIYSEILSYSSNKENGSKSAIAYFNDNLLKYFEKINLLKISNIIKVTNEKKIDFPYNSVSTMLLKSVIDDENLRKLLHKYTIVSSYISKEDEKLVKLINGNLLMNREEQEKFNSKYYFRILSQKYNYSIPKGIEINGLNDITKIEKFKKDNPNIDNIWIKLESQSSGTGNIKINNFKTISLNEIKQKIYDISKKIYDDKYIYEQSKIILEEDINTNGYKEVCNIGVEAVITKDKIVILGGVEQITKNGIYIGSIVSDNTYKYLEFAEKTASDAFYAYAKEGYVGFITIDVLVTQNNLGKIKSYNIDPNARFSAGTMLLKNIHSAEVKNHRKMYGLSYAFEINKIDNNLIQDIIEKTGINEYNIDVDNKGIIPALVNDLYTVNDDSYYLKCIVIEDSFEKALNVFNKYKNSLRNLNKDERRKL